MEPYQIDEEFKEFTRPLYNFSSERWAKSVDERKALHKFKLRDEHFHTIPAKQSSVYAKLIIQLKSNDVFPQSTYSIKCFDTNVQNLINRFNEKGNFVHNYSFNGTRHYL
jgi:hypothetical protein